MLRASNAGVGAGAANAVFRGLFRSGLTDSDARHQGAGPVLPDTGPASCHTATVGCESFGAFSSAEQCR
jgi:hypothetical protein